MGKKNKTSRTFEIIIARAIVDSDFRELLLNNKEEVIMEYQLSEDDKSAIRKIDKKTLDLARETAEMVGVVHIVDDPEAE